MKIKNILTGLGVIAMAMLTACGDDDVSESGIFGAPADGAYFSTNLPSKIEVDKNSSTFDLTVTRTSSEGTFTAGIVSNDPDGIFTVPSSVTFADGSATAPLTIGYDASKMESDVNYTLSFQISEGASDYGNGTYSVVVVKPGDWTSWELLADPGVYQYTGVYFSAGEDGPCPVYTRQSLADPNIMQYCFGSVGMDDNSGNPIPAADQFGLMYNVNIYVNRDLTTNYCTVPEVWTGVFNSNYSENVMMSDTHTYYAGSTKEADYPESLSYYNPETGLFTLNVIYYISLGYFGVGNEYFQLGGFSDYSMEIERRGNYVENGKETALFYVYKGEDLESYRYTVLPGTLSQAEVDAAVADLDASEDAQTLTESGMITFDFAEAGTYTVILAGYAGGEIKTVVAKEFNIETVQASSDWESQGYVSYTDGYICSRYPGATPVPYYVELESHKTIDGYYRLVNPYGAAYPYNEDGDYDPNVNSYLYVNAFDPDYVYIEESSSTTNWGNGVMTFSSLVGNYIAGGYDVETIKQAGIPAGTLANGVITFPVESLIIFIGTSGYYANAWISNYTQGMAEEDMIIEATEKIDFNDIVSASQAQSTPSRAYAKVAASKAKRTVFGNVKSNLNLTVSKPQIKGRSVSIKNDVKTMEISGTILK